MDDYHLPNKFKYFIKSYIDNRNVIIDQDDQLPYNIGIHQGSSLRPILWLLVINELLHELKLYREFEVIAFADDILIILRAKASYNFNILSSESLK